MTDQFKDVIKTFDVAAGETPPGFRKELKLEKDGVIHYTKNQILTTGALALEPMKGSWANFPKNIAQMQVMAMEVMVVIVIMHFLLGLMVLDIEVVLEVMGQKIEHF